MPPEPTPPATYRTPLITPAAGPSRPVDMDALVVQVSDMGSYVWRVVRAVPVPLTLVPPTTYRTPLITPAIGAGHPVAVGIAALAAHVPPGVMLRIPCKIVPPVPTAQTSTDPLPPCSSTAFRSAIEPLAIRLHETTFQWRMVPLEPTAN